MRVKILEAEIKDSGLNVFGGDILTVDDEIARVWVGYGWAEDVTGRIPTGQRPRGEVDLVIDNSLVGHKARYPG